MKKLLFSFLLFAMSVLCYSQFNQNSLYAVVDGNTVTLYDQGAYRNCCAVYEMILTLEDEQLTWMQQSAGEICYCMCYFDLQATTGPLEAGSYVTDVYYNDIPGEEPVFVGSIDFTIEMPAKADTLEVLDFYQSNCYYLVPFDENKVSENTINCYPNPAEGYMKIKCRVNAAADIRILNILGQEVRHFKLSRAGEYTINWDLTDQNGQTLKGGLYFNRLETGSEKVSGKLMVR